MSGSSFEQELTSPTAHKLYPSEAQVSFILLEAIAGLVSCGSVDHWLETAAGRY